MLQDNIRQLVEQAAAASGGQNEERTSDRIETQTAELDKLTAARRRHSRQLKVRASPSPGGGGSLIAMRSIVMSGVG